MEQDNLKMSSNYLKMNTNLFNNHKINKFLQRFNNLKSQQKDQIVEILEEEMLNL